MCVYLCHSYILQLQIFTKIVIRSMITILIVAIIRLSLNHPYNIRRIKALYTLSKEVIISRYSSF